MKIPVIALVASFLATISCNKPKTQDCVSTPVNKNELSGKFAQYGYSNIQEPVSSSSRHKFYFYSDSFRMERHSLVKNPSPDSCKATSYYEYARGIWNLNGGQLKLRGIYTNELYDIKTNSCYQSDSFDYQLGIGKCNDTLTFIMPGKSTTLWRGGIKLCAEQ